jgi:hypothetical protein
MRDVRAGPEEVISMLISKAHENLIVTGQTGTGKSWVACAFGRQAARLDHSVLYVRVPRLFEETCARSPRRPLPAPHRQTHPRATALDDFGTHSLTDQQRFHLFEIVEERYRRKSTIITAKPRRPDGNRIVHNAHRIVLQGDSMRKQKAAPLTRKDFTSAFQSRGAPIRTEPRARHAAERSKAEKQAAFAFSPDAWERRRRSRGDGGIRKRAAE